MDLTKAGVVLIIIIILVIVLYTMFSKSARRYYKKAESCHRKGEYYHDMGDEELSHDYYKESEYFRKKAGELENVVQ
ncbi:hypothetical protein J4231_01425 [Candidatus Woesearchaeota archaeon]|nr:hypothetical protein [Candidatus Woesearchaeota archaeon]